jgi:crossover junction endodeoxyribonuclease RuvC
MRILGVDPGLQITGYGIIEVKGRDFKLLEAGVIRTPSGQSISKRLLKIYGGLEEIIKEFGPEYLILEKLYSHYGHPTTAILMGHARGVICLLSGMYSVKLLSYSSTRIKKAVTGKGHATKTQVQRMVQNLLGLRESPKPVDVTDALAMAMSYVYITQKGEHDIENPRKA